MKKLFSFLGLVLLPFWVASQNVYSLKQCIDMAWTNNLQVKRTALQLETAETNFLQSKNNKLPIFGGNYNLGLNNGRSIDPFTNGYITQQLLSSNAGINGEFVLYNGLRVKNGIKQNGILTQVAKMDMQQEKDNLALNVILAYLQVLNNEDLLKLANTQAAVTQKQLDRLEILNKAGAIQPAILYDMKGQFATDELSIVNVQNALSISKLMLTQLMNLPFDNAMRLEKLGSDNSPDAALTAYDAPVSQVYADALKHLAVVQAAELRQESAKMAMQIAASNYYPRVSLFGQLGTNYSSAAQRSLPIGTSDVVTPNFVEVNGNRFPVFRKETNFKEDKIGYFSQLGNNLNSFVGVNVQIPIFTAFQTKTLVNLAKIQEKSATNVSESLKLQLKQAIEQAHLNTTTAYDRFAILNRQVQAFQLSFNAAEKRFTEGVIHSVDYLIVKNNLDRARANWVNARYEYLLRVKVLDFYRGKE
jgi:outer membrane protein